MSLLFVLVAVLVVVGGIVVVVGVTLSREWHRTLRVAPGGLF